MSAEAGEAPEQIGLAQRARGLSWLWLVGIGLYVAAATAIGWDDVASALAHVDPRWLAAMVCVELIVLWVRAGKWHLALGPGNGAVAQAFLSKAGGNLTPARLGEASPLLLKRFRHPRTGAWIVLDRLMEAGATLLFGFFGVLFVFGVSGQNALFIWTGVVTALVGIVTFILLRGGASSWLRAALEPNAHSGRRGAVARFVCEAADEATLLGPKAPMLGAITLGTTALDIVIGICLFASFGEMIPYLTLAVAQCAHAITSILPFSPSVTGIPYAAAAGILNQTAEVPLDVLAAAVAVRLVFGNAVFWTSFALGTQGLWSKPKFTEQGGLFDHLASDGELYAYDEEALATVSALVGDAGLVLDVGCGDGLIGAALRGEVVGLEISPACARTARGRGLHVLVGDAVAHLPFADNAFDTVACIDVLHHLDRNWVSLLSEYARVLKPGGRLVLVEPDARNPFVRWTQAPRSPIRVAPWPNEPAIYPAELTSALDAIGFPHRLAPTHIEGEQNVRDVFPFWQRLLKAPFVIVLSRLYRGRPNKFSIIAEKPTDAAP